MHESSADLLDRARAGDRAALESLLERHQAQVYRFGMRMCRDAEDAKDVLQDTLLAVARGVQGFRGSSSLSTWLFTIARSFCIKQRRRARSAPSSLDSLESLPPDHAALLEDPAKIPDEELATKRIEQALEEAIAALEPEYREVLLLRDVEGLPAADVADVLGLSVAAVKSRLHRARLAVRDRIAPRLGIPREARAATCPDVLTLYSRHLEEEISAEVCLRMQTHLEGCAPCRGACASLKSTLALCGSAREGEPLPPAVRASVQAALRACLSPRS